MSDDFLRYDRLIEAALRGVIREAIRQVAELGLEDGHHFYISFRTDFPGVVIPEHLRSRYPEEMTIVLQHQFHGLKVTEDCFKVGLSFGGVMSELTVPFEAVTAFTDPSVNFALQFQYIGEGGVGEEEVDTKKSHGHKAKTGAEKTHAKGEIIDLEAFRKKK